jgi:integrase
VGKLYKRDRSPYWWARWQDANGETQRESTRTTDRRVAALWLSAREGEVVKASAGLPTARRVLLSQAVAEFLVAHRPPIWSEKWHHVAGLWWRSRLLPGLGPDTVVSAITQADVEALRVRWLHGDDKIAKVKPPTVNRLTACGGKFFKWAMKRGYALENPFAGHSKFAEEPAEPPTIDDELLARWLAAIAHPVLRRAATVAADTGLRRSEIERLAKKDLKSSGLLWIASSYDRGHNKTNNARYIPLTPRALAALQDQSEVSRSALIFGPLPEYRNELRKAQEAAGLPAFRWHDLRHFALTRAANEGALGHDLKLLAGWRSLDMANRYVHGDVRRLQAVVERMGECAPSVQKQVKKQSKIKHNADTQKPVTPRND